MLSLRTQKVFHFLGNTIITILFGTIILAAIGAIPFFLNVANIINTTFPQTFFQRLTPIFLAALALILLLLIPYIILSCVIPAPEQQMAQQIKEIQERLAQQEKQVEQLQQQIQDIPSPLLNLNEKQQKEIIDKLTLVAQPKNNDNKLNRAKTAQFLRALQILWYIDENTAPNQLRLCTQQVTGFQDNDKVHFNEAYNKANINGGEVKQFIQNIQKLLSKDQ